jgi:hypothetical protein
MATVVKFLKSIFLLVVYALVVLLGADDVQTWTLDDFEDGNLESASGLSWIVIADDLGGGATDARLEVTAGGNAPSRHALRLGGGDAWRSKCGADVARTRLPGAGWAAHRTPIVARGAKSRTPVPGSDAKNGIAVRRGLP